MMIVAALIVFLASIFLRFGYLIKNRGRDPALITQSSIIFVKDYWPARALGTAGLIALIVYGPAAEFILWLFLFFSVFQILVLLVFNRQYTQPAMCYVFVAVASTAGLAFTKVLAVTSVVLLFGADEIYFRWWKRHQARLYDRWVERMALKINLRYRKSAGDISTKQWCWVLHIATTEAIARPAASRLLERIYYRFRRPAYISTGIMQVASAKPVSDTQSVIAGTKKVCEILNKMPPKLKNHDEQLRWFAKHYNGSLSYSVYLKATSPGVAQACRKLN